MPRTGQFHGSLPDGAPEAEAYSSCESPAEHGASGHFTHYVQFVESENALNKVFPQYRIVQATVFFDGQPWISFKEGGGEQPDTLLAAPVAVSSYSRTRSMPQLGILHRR